MPANISAGRQKAITTTGVSTMPKAYVIAAETISDEAGFAQYRPAVPPTVSTFGGKFIVRGGIFTNLEGGGRTHVLRLSSSPLEPPPRVGITRLPTRRSFPFATKAR
jgi:hypothetical protein